jgi:hypothetical protein
MLWRIFGSKREEVAGGCRRLHSEELRNLYVSANVVRMIKSRRTCSTDGRVKKRIMCFSWKTLREETA